MGATGGGKSDCFSGGFLVHLPRVRHERENMTGKSSRLYLWVLAATVLGVFIGVWAPAVAIQLKPLGDGFLGLVKMVIAPVIFCTIVLGLAEAGDVKKVGRVGLKTILYFEVVSTFALIIGLCVANFFGPGKDFHATVESLDAKAVAEYADKAHGQSIADFLLHIIPKTFLDSFSGSGDLLQVLLIALLFGIAINRLGKVAQPVLDFIHSLSQVLFKIVQMVMVLAPLGAGGAIAFTVGKFGLASLKPLLSLMACFYLTCLVFIFLVLGVVAKVVGFSIWKYLTFIRDELFTVLATSSSESVLVALMHKLESIGCSRSVVGLVIPAGYSFNLDGTNIYLTLAALFVAQALGIDLTLTEQLGLLTVAMLTSKGASGVTGAGFITLAATLAVVPKVPVAGLALILGVDRFMSEARAITNMIGNGIATIVISKWEKELDEKKFAILK